MRPALQLNRRITRLIAFSDVLSTCQRASGFVLMNGLLYLVREFDALLHFGEGFRAKSFRGVAKHFGVGFATQDFYDSSSYSRLVVADHHAVHQDRMDVGILGDPIHYLLVIFQGNIYEYPHGLRLVSLPYTIASGFLTKWVF